LAEELLNSVEMTEINGNDLEPVKMPPDTPTCTAFDYSQYASEAAGNQDALKHHEAQLKALGVTFGRGGYQMQDTCNVQRAGLVVQAGGKTYRGNCDGCITPFGIARSSAFHRGIIAYEHKRREGVRAQDVGGIQQPCIPMQLHVVCSVYSPTHIA
jgi:hypothetical protein